jgi:hypothetical protein
MSNISTPDVTPTIDEFLDSLYNTAISSNEMSDDAQEFPPLPPLTNSRATDWPSSPPPPIPPPVQLTRAPRLPVGDPEPGLELHYLDEGGSSHPYGVKKVNHEFYVYNLADIYPLRSHNCVGKAIRGPDGDGPLTGIDRTRRNPDRPNEQIAMGLFPPLAE